MAYDAPRARAENEKRRGLAREDAEDLLRWADHLPRDDRALIHAVLRDGRSARLLAQLGGGEPSTVSKRLRRLVRRMHSREFQLVALRGPQFQRDERKAVELIFLAGRSCRETARRTGLPLHRVRRLHDAIHQMVALFDPLTPSRRL